jgi:hypothetical protein
MKKLLLGTSAIALAGAIATPASAAEWEMRVGGYLEEFVAYADSSNDNITGDFDGVDVKSDGEIHFSPRIILDNGLKFGARIELETASVSDQIDENYAYIEGSFGRLELGSDDNAAYKMQYSAPDVTFMNINSGSDTDWLPFAAEFEVTTTFISVEGDSQGIRYFTPRMAGFQVGVSYARDANRSDDDAQKDSDEDGELFDIFGVGANYVNSFGAFDIAVAGGYVTGSMNGKDAASGFGAIVSGDVTDGEFGEGIHEFTCDELDDFEDEFPDADFQVTTACSDEVSGKDPNAWSAGLVLGYQGFSIGGSYANWNNSAISDGLEVYDLGVAYETGPWGFSFTYMHGEVDTDGGEIDKFMLGMDYKLAVGVRLGAFAIYEDGDSDSGTQDWDGDGFIIGTGLKLNF